MKRLSSEFVEAQFSRDWQVFLSRGDYNANRLVNRRREEPLINIRKRSDHTFVAILFFNFRAVKHRSKACFTSLLPKRQDFVYGMQKKMSNARVFRLFASQNW